MTQHKISDLLCPVCGAPVLLTDAGLGVVATCTKTRHTDVEWREAAFRLQGVLLRAARTARRPATRMTRAVLFQNLGEARARIRQLEQFIRNVRDNYDCDSDGHKYNTGCRVCEAKALLENPASAGQDADTLLAQIRPFLANKMRGVQLDIKFCFDGFILTTRDGSWLQTGGETLADAARQLLDLLLKRRAQTTEPDHV